MRLRVEATEPARATILSRVFDAAFFEQNIVRTYHGKNGKPSDPDSWALDMRIPLSQSEFAQPLGYMIYQHMQENGINQIAGRGYGSFCLVGAVLGQAKTGDVRAGLIRDQRKGYGFKELVEGSLRKGEPTLIVDDLLSTGSSIQKAKKALESEGFCAECGATIFRYGWKTDTQTDNLQGFKVFSLASLFKP